MCPSTLIPTSLARICFTKIFTVYINKTNYYVGIWKGKNGNQI